MLVSLFGRVKRSVVLRRAVTEQADRLFSGGGLLGFGWLLGRSGGGSSGTALDGCGRRRRFCIRCGRGFWFGSGRRLDRRVGGPEVTVALWTLPELLRRPWIFRSRIRQVHWGAAPLTTNADVGVVHGETNCSVQPQ